MWNRNFVFMMIANSLVVGSYLMLSPTFPLYLEQLGNAQDIVGLLTGIFVVTAMAARPFAGRWLDAGHRKDTYLYGQLASAAAIACYPITHAFWPLLLLRLLHGIGIGITTTAANTIAADFIPRHRLGEGIGYFSLGTVVSMAVAPGLGLFLMEQWGVHALFGVSAGFVAAGAALGLTVRYDRRRTTAPRNAAKTASAQFDLIERRAVKPAVVATFSGLSFSVVSTYVAIYAAQKNVGSIGLFFTVYALTLVLSRPGSGLLADRKGPASAIVPGLLLQVGSMVLLYFADHLSLFLAAAVIFGAGNGATQSTLNSVAVSQSPQERRGAAVSTFYLGLDVAAGLGPVLGGLAAKQWGYSAMYLATVVPILIGLILYLKRDGHPTAARQDRSEDA
ncbi:MFS transporter [Cohnella caldifontis]|uniref:MFS transporter n=1 Tax=Cohnella caldifontis TaxID=3027471 RepID=UPI0023EB0A9D|nr:MFS transporter [Cohnella sp. YIM B05605]